MCGICGISAHPSSRINMTTLTRSLLKGIENRGTHATGVTFSGAQQPTTTVKKAVAARNFAPSLTIPAGVSTVLGHTRFATQGSPTTNENNHPIVVPTNTGSRIHGIHNGCLWNDDELFEALDPNTRIAQVDSEAAFAWLGRSGLQTTHALEDIMGSAALAWIDDDEPDLLHLARVDSSPLVIAHTTTGELMFASTATCLTAAARTGGLDVKAIVDIPEGTYLQVTKGRVVHRENFEAGFRAGGQLTADERLALGH